MKFNLFVCSAIIIALASCSPKSDSTSPGKTFSFDIADTTKAGDMTIAIERAFLDNYALLDTSLQSAGQLMTTTVLSYDSVTGKTKCIDGYTMQLNEYSKSGGEWVRNSNKIYFFSGSGFHYEVWNNPVASAGTTENVQASMGASVDFLAGDCPILAVYNETSIADPSGGTNDSDRITFYYWSEYEHKLKEVATFTRGYQRAGQENENVIGEVAFIKSDSKPYDIEYKVTGDSTYTEYYGWKNGRYEKK